MWSSNTGGSARSSFPLISWTRPICSEIESPSWLRGRYVVPVSEDNCTGTSTVFTKQLLIMSVLDFINIVFEHRVLCMYRIFRWINEQVMYTFQYAFFEIYTSKLVWAFPRTMFFFSFPLQMIKKLCDLLHVLIAAIKWRLFMSTSNVCKSAKWSSPPPVPLLSSAARLLPQRSLSNTTVIWQSLKPKTTQWFSVYFYQHPHQVWLWC